MDFRIKIRLIAFSINKLEYKLNNNLYALTLLMPSF